MSIACRTDQDNPAVAVAVPLPLPAGITSFWPGQIWFLIWIRFRCAIALTVTPYRWAIPDNVSPRRTTCTVLLLAELVGAEVGMRSRVPALIRFLSRIGLFFWMALTETPYCLAIRDNVSPRRTTWVVSAGADPMAQPTVHPRMIPVRIAVLQRYLLLGFIGYQ